MAFSSKYGTGASSTTTSSADDLSQSDETSAALRAAGFKILRFGAAPQIFLYVGQSNSSNQPHGHGYLYFPNGDIQECEYKAGRAHGNGTLVTVSGSEMKGKWTENKRVGDFALIDAKGEHWIENYAADGKKISKTKVFLNPPCFLSIALHWLFVLGQDDDSESSIHRGRRRDCDSKND
eukprot:m.11785 g.11785  ORF g.11785 m.11785 type:complete len:179 (-) comp16339_c0_seq1:273-809(-)